MGRRIGTLTIASGATRSEVMGLAHITALSIQAPDTLDALTFTVQGSNDGENWSDVDVGGAAVEIAAEEMVNLDPVPFAFVSILSSGAVAADRGFIVAANESM